MAQRIRKSFFPIIAILIPAIFVVWVFFVLPARAITVPRYLGFEGQLSDSSDVLLTGTYDMTFRIYNASSTGAVLWSEPYSNVSVSNGYFNVNLGSSTTLDLPFDKQYWISIEVGSDGEMAPRTQINSVGYAYVSESTFGAFATSSAPTTMVGGSMYYNTTTNNLYLYNGTSWEDLTAVGTSGTSTQTTISDYLWIGDEDADNLDIRAGVWDFTSTATTTVAMTNGLNFDSNTLVIDPNSNMLGIGTSTPAYKLSVHSSNATDNLFQISTTTNANILIVDNNGNFSLNGSVTTIGDSATDKLVLTAGIGSNILPDGNNSRNFGSYGSAWSNIYASSTAYLTFVSSTAMDVGTILSGTWNGASIGDGFIDNNITASNYLLTSDYFTTTTHAVISSIPNLSITQSQISNLTHPFAWSPTTNFGALANSTSTPIWFKQGLMSSTTAYLAYTSSTAMDVGTILSGTWNG
ncbi:MAG: hypothetical protein Q8P20_08260, partial [bacterium]|nr:hypothetical protein [bacterium]